MKVHGGFNGFRSFQPREKATEKVGETYYTWFGKARQPFRSARLINIVANPPYISSTCILWAIAINLFWACGRIKKEECSPSQNVLHSVCARPARKEQIKILLTHYHMIKQIFHSIINVLALAVDLVQLWRGVDLIPLEGCSDDGLRNREPREVFKKESSR